MSFVGLPCRLFLLAAAAAGVIQAATPPLAIVDAAIRQMEDGASLPPGFSHAPGELLFLSFRIEGYRASPDEQVRLSYLVDVLDPKGVRVVEPIAGKIEAALASEDKNWKPKVHPQIQIPPLAGSGTYRISLQVKDEVAQTAVAKELTFSVSGHEVEPSETLVVRNFRFYRSERETQPMEQSVYRPGETLWARFDIIGFRYAEKNRIEVSYGVKVLGPGGKLLYEQPEAATERSAAFYPQRYIPNTMNLSLQASIRPGQYTIVITARDLVGNQTCESQHTFGIQ